MMYFSETESRHVFTRSELVKRLYDYLTMESFWPCVMLSASSSLLLLLLLPKKKRKQMRSCSKRQKENGPAR